VSVRQWIDAVQRGETVHILAPGYGQVTIRPSGRHGIWTISRYGQQYDADRRDTIAMVHRLDGGERISRPLTDQ